MTTITVELSKLQLSPLNVRQVKEGDVANDTGDLEASIPTVGLLSPLIVHHLKKPKGAFGVLAGGRRLLALQRLRDRGVIAADYTVDCVVRDEDAITSTELSVIENTARVALTPAQEFQAFAKLAEDGADEEAIAQRFGVTVLHVRQRMRLGQLHPDILASLDAGKITLDAAKAYAGTTDQALQKRVFDEEIRRMWGGHNAYTIREAIRKAGSAYDTQMMLRFVGLQSYLNAGGVFEEDLFGAAGTGRVVHPATLSELYYAKIEAETAKLQATLPAEVQVTTSPGTVGRYLHIKETLSDEQEQRRREIDRRCDEIHKRLDAIASPGEDDGADMEFAGTLVADRPEDAEEVERLQEELSALEDESEAILAAAKRQFPEGPVIAVAKPTAEGLQLTEFYRPADWVPEGSPDGASRSAYEPPVSTAQKIKAEAGLTGDATEVLRSHRREILRGIMVSCDTESATRIAGDFLTFAALRLTLRGQGSWNYASDLGVAQGAFGTAAMPVLGGDEVRAQEGSKRWGRAIADIVEADWFTEKDLQVAFAKFTELPRFERDTAMAAAAAMFLDRSLGVSGHAVPLHDQIAFLLGADDDETVREFWHPDAAFFSRWGKKWSVAAVRECSPKAAKIIEKLKAADVPAACERFFRADAAAIAEFDMLPGTIAHAKRWLPTFLKFNAGPPGPRLIEQHMDREASGSQAVAA